VPSLKKKQGNGQKPKSEFFGLDCSIVLSWYFSDKSNSYADSVAICLTHSKAIVPTHWALEVANTLIVGERWNRSTQSQANAFIHLLRTLPIVVDEATAEQASAATIALARDLSLTVYDATYLELASRRGAPLATLDSRLKAAAKVIGVPTFVPA
jgi:predicted nucleic acid-binding protein